MLAGLTSDVAPPLLTLVRRSARPGPVNVVGLDICVPAELAAMVNGTLGHALDYDDVIELYPGHPSSVVIGALLASAGAGRAIGADLLTAFIVGVEAGARIGIGLGDGHYARGFHATATIGILAAVARPWRKSAVLPKGAAAGAGHSRIVRQRAAGQFWHHDQAAAQRLGRAGRDCGGRSRQRRLHRERGHPGCRPRVLATFGDHMSTTAGIKGSLGRPFVFDSPGVGMKRYPCYNGVHRATDAAREVVQANNVSPDDVAVITCRMPPGRLQAVLYHAPTTGLEAKFSYEYVLAATVLDGSVGIESFTEAAVSRPKAVRLMKRVVLVEDPVARTGAERSGHAVWAVAASCGSRSACGRAGSTRPTWPERRVRRSDRLAGTRLRPSSPTVRLPRTSIPRRPGEWRGRYGSCRRLMTSPTPYAHCGAGMLRDRPARRVPSFGSTKCADEVTLAVCCRRQTLVLYSRVVMAAPR
jgi:hypothetical protein